MKRRPAHTDVTRPDPKFRWTYIFTRFQDSYVHKSLQKILNIVRCGVPQSDWVSGSIWGSKVIRTGPPRSRKFLLFFYSGIEPPK